MGLVESRTPESRTLEYKRALPATDDAAKREFLADVTAFANTGGGVVLFGIDADPSNKGVPREVVGIGPVDLDAEKLRLEGMLHNGVSPSLRAQVTFQAVPVPPATTPVLAVGVPRSLTAPHRVVSNGSNRFYRRSDAGKYEPDVPELRRMFVTSQSLPDEADAFRRERLRRIAAGEIRPDVTAPSRFFVHVLPLGRLDQLLDVQSAAEQLNSAAPLIGVSGWDYGYNADGYWTFNRGRDRGPASALRAYAQWFRFGGAELYAAEPVSREDNGADKTPTFRGPYLVGALRYTLPRVLGALSDALAVDPPYVVALSLSGARGAVMVRDPARFSFFDDPVSPLDRDDLLLPAVLVEDPGADAAQYLRPALNVLWQAFGFAEIPAAYLSGPARR